MDLNAWAQVIVLEKVCTAVQRVLLCLTSPSTCQTGYYVTHIYLIISFAETSCLVLIGPESTHRHTWVVVAWQQVCGTNGDLVGSLPLGWWPQCAPPRHHGGPRGAGLLRRHHTRANGETPQPGWWEAFWIALQHVIHMDILLGLNQPAKWKLWQRMVLISSWRSWGYLYFSWLVHTIWNESYFYDFVC